MIHLRPFRTTAVLVLVVAVVASASSVARAQVPPDWAGVYRRWASQPTSDVLAELRHVQSRARSDYGSYVTNASIVRRRLLRFYSQRHEPGDHPHITRWGDAKRAWRRYQLDLTKAQLLTTILRQRQAAKAAGKPIPKVNPLPPVFQPKFGFAGMNQANNGFPAMNQANMGFPAMNQAMMGFPAMNQQWKALAQLPGKMYLQFFDANQDGKLSSQEAANTPLASRFAALDSNHDGFLTPVEMAR